MRKGSDILLGFTPQIGFAGFQAEKDGGNSFTQNAVWFDNFASMVVTTPEPASALLLAVGGLLVVRRKG